uniref:SPX domain-containing protein n=1 Tax=Pinguiococcus pyrenoidosus TaxID=172671 RepID=A0A7R9U475_9STRA
MKERHKCDLCIEMVNFGHEMEAKAGADEWQGFYIRYEDLKRQIEDFTAQLRRLNARRSQSLGDLSGPQHRFGYLGRNQTFQNLQDKSEETEATLRADQMKTFAELLDRDLTVLVCFSLEQQGRLAAKVRRLIAEREAVQGRIAGTSDVENNKKAETARIVGELCSVGREVIHIINFLETNLTGVRKILKKFDKVLRASLAVRYLRSRCGPWGILSGTRAHTLYTLAGAIATQLKELTALDPSTDAEGLISLNPNHAPNDGVLETISVLEELKEARTRLEESQERISTDYLTATSRVALETSLSVPRLTSTDDGLSQDSHSPGGPQASFINPDDFADDFNLFRDWSHVLNLASTFLYMSNYYIVGPTGGAYAERLGGGSSLSALVIGCTPLMATISAVLYSTWTNTSFKRPLLWCSFLMTLGNLCYATALPFEALWMVRFVPQY